MLHQVLTAAELADLGFDDATQTLPEAEQTLKLGFYIKSRRCLLLSWFTLWLTATINTLCALVYANDNSTVTLLTTLFMFVTILFLAVYELVLGMCFVRSGASCSPWDFISYILGVNNNVVFLLDVLFPFLAWRCGYVMTGAVTGCICCITYVGFLGAQQVRMLLALYNSPNDDYIIQDPEKFIHNCSTLCVPSKCVLFTLLRKMIESKSVENETLRRQANFYRPTDFSVPSPSNSNLFTVNQRRELTTPTPINETTGIEMYANQNNNASDDAAHPLALQQQQFSCSALNTGASNENATLSSSSSSSGEQEETDGKHGNFATYRRKVKSRSNTLFLKSSVPCDPLITSVSFNGNFLYDHQLNPPPLKHPYVLTSSYLATITLFRWITAFRCLCAILVRRFARSNNRRSARLMPSTSITPLTPSTLVSTLHSTSSSSSSNLLTMHRQQPLTLLTPLGVAQHNAELQIITQEDNNNNNLSRLIDIWVRNYFEQTQQPIDDIKILQLANTAFLINCWFTESLLKRIFLPPDCFEAHEFSVAFATLGRCYIGDIILCLFKSFILFSSTPFSFLFSVSLALSIFQTIAVCLLNTIDGDLWQDILTSE